VKRRAFIATLGGVAAAALVQSARAQTRPKRVIYFAPSRTEHLVSAFLDGLKREGLVVGQDLAIDFRFADEQSQPLAAIARELPNAAPDLIVAVGIAAALQVKLVTGTIPVVFAPAADPVRSGLVSSLAFPAGNVTGVSLYASELNRKRLDVFKAAVPSLRRVGVLRNTENPSHSAYWDDMQSGAERLGIELHAMLTAGRPGIEEAFATGQNLDGLAIPTDAEFDAGRDEIVRLATARRLPTIYEHRAFVDAGGLMSYGPDIDNMSNRAASYVARILRGAKPSELPIEQPTRFELIVSLKAATALNLTFPTTFLARADEVIE
jgi:putative ABC transport system substrate-binding protein